MALPEVVNIETARLAICKVSEEDLPDLLEINGDDAVTRFLPYATWKSLNDGTAWLKRMNILAESGTSRQLVIVRHTDNKVIGTALLFRYDEGSARIELGYVIGRTYWRQGYAGEALKALCDYAFRKLGIRRIEAEADPDNIASNMVLISLGFKKEGLLRKRWITKESLRIPISTAALLMNGLTNE